MRMVLCIIRFLEKPKYMINPTIKTGAPITAIMTTATIGITSPGISSLPRECEICPDSSPVASSLPMTKLTCFLCFFSIFCSQSLCAVGAGETEVAGEIVEAGLAASAGVGGAGEVCAKTLQASPNEQRQVISSVFIGVICK